MSDSITPSYILISSPDLPPPRTSRTPNPPSAEAIVSANIVTGNDSMPLLMTCQFLVHKVLMVISNFIGLWIHCLMVTEHVAQSLRLRRTPSKEDTLTGIAGSFGGSPHSSVHLNRSPMACAWDLEKFHQRFDGLIFI